MSILAPLTQCCQIRSSTAKTLIELATSSPGNQLGDRLRQSMASVAGNRKVGEAHLAAINRRVKIVLDQVERCSVQNETLVVIDDGL